MQHVPPQIRWGKQNEDKACQPYIENSEALGEITQVTCCGLHLMSEKSYLGASSDGKVLCISVYICCTGCIEIKCPYSIEISITIELSLDDIADVMMATYIYHSTKYITHSYMEMALFGVDWCDFVVYSSGCVIFDCILADLHS